MNKIYIIICMIFSLSHLTFTQGTSLELLNQFRGEGEMHTYAVQNNLLYIVVGNYLKIYDISMPGIFTQHGEYLFTSTIPYQINVKGDYLYSSNGNNGIQIFDVSNPDSIILKNIFYPSISGAWKFSIYENKIAMEQIIGYGSSHVLLGDLIDPLQIVEKGDYTLPFYSEDFSVTMRENLLFIIAQKYYEITYLGANMIIVDISDLENPIQTFNLHSGFKGLAIQDHYLLTTDTSTTLKIFDVADPSNALLINEIPFNNMSFSIDNYNLITRQPISPGYQRFNLYNSSLITDLILKDTLTLQNENNPYMHSVFGNDLLLGRSYDLTIYDISNEYFEYDKKLNFPDDFSAKDILIEGEYAYLLGDTKLYILDISNPASPELISDLQLRDEGSFSNIFRISFEGNYIFVSGTEDITICDVSNPYNPFIAGSLEKAGIAYDLTIKGDFVYLTSLGESSLPPYNIYKGFEIIDVSDKANPYQISYTDLGEDALGIAIDSDYAYILTKHLDSPQNYSSDIYIYDVSEPETPVELNVKNFPFISSRITISGNYAYLATNQGLKILDISDKINPSLTGSFGPNLNVRDVSFYRETVSLAADYDGLYVVNVSDKNNPVQLESYDTDDRAQGVKMQEENIYVASGISGLYLLKFDHGSSAEEGDDSNNDSGFVPTKFTLLQNFPNPFNNGTKIEYFLPENEHIQIDVFDILGNNVTVLINSVKNAGWHEFNYNPKDLSSGIYLLRAKSTNNIIVKKILYLK